MQFSRRNLFGFVGAAAVTAAIPKEVLAEIVAPIAEPTAPVAVLSSGAQLITAEALQLFKNSNSFMQTIDSERKRAREKRLVPDWALGIK